MEIRLVALINSHQGFIQSGKNKLCTIKMMWQRNGACGETRCEKEVPLGILGS
jgi:hypothetical protein